MHGLRYQTLSASADTYFYIHYGNDGSVFQIDRSSQVWDGQSTGGKTYVIANHLDSTPTSANNDKEMIGSLAGTKDDLAAGKSDMDADNIVDGKIHKALEVNKGVANNQFVCLETIDTNYHDCAGDSEIFTDGIWLTEGNVRSVSIWYKAVTTDNGSYQVIFEEGGSNGQSIYLFEDKIYGVTSRNSVVGYGSTATTANEWHHVVLIWADDADSYLYHDGVLRETFTGKDFNRHTNEGALGHSDASSARHESGNNVGGFSFDGIMDEFRVTDTRLPDDYIENMYNAENDPTNFVREGIHLSETLSLTDSTSEIKSRIVPLSETISLTDSRSNDTIINLSETLSLTDATDEEEEEGGGGGGGEEREPQEVAESISLTDSITKEINKQLSESISFTDSASRVGSNIISISESVAMADSIIRIPGVNLSESISFTDSASTVAENTVSISESIALTDNASRVGIKYYFIIRVNSTGR